MLSLVKRSTLLAALAVAAAVAAPSGAFALGTADQQQPLADGSIGMPPGIAQTFTVGRSGMLDGFALNAVTAGTVVYQLYALRPDGTPDVTRPMLPQNGTAALYPGVRTDIAVTPFMVTAGQRLALALGTVRSYATLDLATATGDPYAAGDLFQVVSITSFTAVPAVDLQFTTYVSPYPTTLTLATLKSSGGRPTAVLRYGSPAAALPGRTVRFDLRRADGSVKDSCSATTDATGTATCAKVRWQVPSGGSLLATSAGDATYAAASASVTS